MVGRCYSRKILEKHPTYNRCRVALEWKSFSNFKLWMEKQDWQGKFLDKDLLSGDIYSPNTCLFVTRQVNNFMTEVKSSRGEYPTGVSFHKRDLKYQASCNDNGKSIFLGYFDDVATAKNEYDRCKSELAIRLAGKQTDNKVAEALIIRYNQHGFS